MLVSEDFFLLLYPQKRNFFCVFWVKKYLLVCFKILYLLFFFHRTSLTYVL
nr:MAG TPA: hypothetical protein [Caudoviricetes sp.]